VRISTHPARREMRSRTGPTALLVASAVCLATAPLLLPSSYSWVAHTTSESAAQGVEGAWLARMGFLLWGFGVFWEVRLNRSRWDKWTRRFHVAFGVLMIATAAFSARPWVADAQFDPTEDTLHSFTATAMGFAFALGVLGVMLHQLRNGSRRVTFEVIAIAAATLIPICMSIWGDVDGLLQRLMFLTAYSWYVREAF